MKGLIVKEKGLIEMTNDLEMPQPQAGEVLVKIEAASVNPYDVESAAGTYDAYFEEYQVDVPVRTGLEFSGTVVGKSERFAEGAPVYGYVHLISGWKTHAEYIVVPEAYLAHKPSHLSFAQAASMPLGLMTSLAVFEDLASKASNQSVLIVGASGGVGVYAVQVAKHLGFQVTATAKSSQTEFLQKLGADVIVDFSQQGLPQFEERYDVVLDLSTKLTFSECEHLLTETGKFIPALPDENNGGTLESERVGYLMVMNGDGERLENLTPELDAQKIVPVVERTFSFDQHSDAFAHLAQRGKQGRIVMTWETA